jgi:hypothetical protein
MCRQNCHDCFWFICLLQIDKISSDVSVLITPHIFLASFLSNLDFCYKALSLTVELGWVFNGKGEVMLISHAPHANGLGSTSATCYQR